MTLAGMHLCLRSKIDTPLNVPPNSKLPYVYRSQAVLNQ